MSKSKQKAARRAKRAAEEEKQAKRVITGIFVGLVVVALAILIVSMMN